MKLTDAKRLVREPMYQQMNEIMRALLKTGEFSEGDRFLTERQIAERFQVSRPTANKVLAGMVSEGLLEFKKGVGTFVCPPPLNYDIQTLISFTQKVIDAGKTPATRVLEFKRINVVVSWKLKSPPNCRCGIRNSSPSPVCGWRIEFRSYLKDAGFPPTSSPDSHVRK